MTARHEAKQEELRQDAIEKHKLRLLKIKAQLEAPDYQQDQDMAAEARNNTNAGDWVSQSLVFQNWVSETATGHTSSVLYLHGIPGAGKEYNVVLIYIKMRSLMLTFSRQDHLGIIHHCQLARCKQEQR